MWPHEFRCAAVLTTVPARFALAIIFFRLRSTAHSVRERIGPKRTLTRNILVDTNLHQAKIGLYSLHDVAKNRAVGRYKSKVQNISQVSVATCLKCKCSGSFIFTDGSVGERIFQIFQLFGEVTYKTIVSIVSRFCAIMFTAWHLRLLQSCGYWHLSKWHDDTGAQFKALRGWLLSVANVDGIVVIIINLQAYLSKKHNTW